MAIEQVILSNLLSDEDFVRKTIPYLKSEYFFTKAERLVFEEIQDFINKYNSLPSREAIVISLDKKDNLSDDDYKECCSVVSSLVDETKNKQWLLAETESFCQQKALYTAIMESIKIIDGNSEKSAGTIQDLVVQALSVSFDPNIGHDFIENVDARYDFYHRTEERVGFDLSDFNDITAGGFPRKTLNIIMASTGVGKSLMMCHMASHNLLDGKNVLYITMEMAEESIAQRIDANLLNIQIADLVNVDRETYRKKVDKIKAKTNGKLIIKEYPTSSVHVGHFRHLLNELKLKKNFIPDIIYIDYLNICLSCRVKGNSNANSYTIVKNIAEELRGMAVEFNVPVVSATQTKREGANSSDVDLTDTSESWGLPATADFFVAVITTDELEALSQYLVKQLKNRYTDLNKKKKFVIGVDKAKMRLFNVEQNGQHLSTPEAPSKKGKGKSEPGSFEKASKKIDKDKFADFTFGNSEVEDFDLDIPF